MKNSIKSIILKITIFILTIGVCISPFIMSFIGMEIISKENAENEMNIIAEVKENTDMSRTSKLKLNDGYVNITEEITILVNNNAMSVFALPKLDLYKKNEYSRRKNISNINIKINDQEIEAKQNFKLPYFYLEESMFYINNFTLNTNEEYKVEITYDLEIIDFVDLYTDYSVFYINDSEYFDNDAIYINMGEDASFYSKELAGVEFVQKGPIAIDLKQNNFVNEEDETCIAFDKIFAIYEAKGKFDQNIIESYFGESYTSIVIRSITFLIVEIVLLIFLIKSKYIVVNKEEMVKDYNGLLPPVLAETVVNNKLEAKNLLTASIIDLITRKNIELIDDDTIRLKNSENLTLYEKSIVEFLFKYGNELKFSELKKVFLVDQVKTKELCRIFENIKNTVMEELYLKRRIFSEKYKKILKGIKIGIVAIFLQCFIMICEVITGSSFEIKDSQSILFAVLIILLPFIIVNDKNRLEVLRSLIQDSRMFIALCMAVVLIAVLIRHIVFTFKFALIAIVVVPIIVLGAVIYKMTNGHILTKRGKKEYENLYKLRTYIKDYSFMSEREISDTIIWDKYLAYAAAFGIPNKVTSKISENLMEINKILEKIDYVIS